MMDHRCQNQCCDLTDSSSHVHPLYNIIESDSAHENVAENNVAPLSFLTVSPANGSQHIHALEQTLGLIDSLLQPNYSGMMAQTGPLLTVEEAEPFESLMMSGEKRPKSFLHDEMNEFNQIFSELVSTPQRRFPCRDPSHVVNWSRSHALPSTAVFAKISSTTAPVFNPNTQDDSTVHGLSSAESVPLDVIIRQPNRDSKIVDVHSVDEILLTGNHNISSDPILTEGNHNLCSDPVLLAPECKNGDVQTAKTDVQADSPRRRSEGNSVSGTVSGIQSSLDDGKVKGFSSLNGLECLLVPCDRGKACEPMNEEDADSGYQTGDSSVLAMVSAAKKLEEVTSSNSWDELFQRIEKFNSNKLGLNMNLCPDSVVYNGNIRVHMNIYRPIKMSLSSRPSSIYDILIRSDALLPENESSIALFQLPSNTSKAIHITSETTTNQVIKTLLNKFNITDNPKIFALYERILPNEDAKKVSEADSPLLNNTLSFVRRLADDDRPLELSLRWADHGLDLLDRCQFVLQENDPGEITWEAFSLPELNNFLRILAKEEYGYAEQIRIRYRLLRREIEKRLQRLENERNSKKTS